MNTGDAVALHHMLDGPEDAPVLVVSNSLGTTLRMWDDQAPALLERFRLLRYDHRGHGNSPVPPGPYKIDDLGRDVLTLLDRHEVERFSYCGLSVGGRSACGWPARFPSASNAWCYAAPQPVSRRLSSGTNAPKRSGQTA